jgi:amino acid adenylation domain-containing protein
MSDISKRIEALSPQQRLLLLEKLKKKSDTQEDQPALPVTRNRNNTHPLSFEQERLWFLEKLNPGTSIYNTSSPLVLKGKVDIKAFEKSVNEIIRRHEILRASFKDEGETPVQTIAPASNLELPLLDYRNLAKEIKDTRVQEILRNVKKQPFDLSRPPLYRHIILRAAEEEYIYFAVIHHLVFDGLSIRIILKEIKEAYDNFSRGISCQLPDLPLHYIDYVAWQKKRFDNRFLGKLLSYWKERLKGPLPHLDLPTDYSPVNKEIYQGAVEEYNFSPEVVSKIKILGNKENFTPVNILLAAFKALLLRYTGQEDIIVGMPFSNRIQPEFSSIVGFFANTLVLRSHLSGNPTFLELLSRINESVLGAMEHQELPMHLLVKELQPNRHLSPSPFFQVMFNIIELRGDFREESSGIIWEMVKPASESTEFILTWEIVTTDANLRLNVEYSADHFKPTTIQRMVNHYRVLVEEVASHPNQYIEKIPILVEVERHQLLIEFNDTDAEFDEKICLHQMFEHQVEQVPGHIAAEFNHQALCYDQLEYCSNQLAHYLRCIGVRSDTPVALCLDRSLEMVIALIGILKAGGGYLPIEPTTPDPRIQAVTADAGAPVMITREALCPKLTLDCITLLCYDSRLDQIELQSTDRINDLEIGPENLCSVYYTSGSTGKPKGVVNIHKGWVNRMLWMQSQYQFTPRERILQKTTLTFDDSAVEFFWPLSVGAGLALMEPELHKDPYAIKNDAIRCQVTLIQFVPSMLTLFLDSLQPGDKEKLACLKYVISSGEALRPELVRSFLEKLDCTLHNQWGLTEVSIDSTMHTCSPEDAVEGTLVPIGKPFANNQVYILDRQLNPVPVGVYGDIYIGGVGLARGYINNMEESVKAFVPNPFKPGKVMYSTGDRGYFKDDGSVVFLGRLDEQIKIRGQRVELGEIESILQNHPAISTCAVIGKKTSNDYSIIAYYVLSQPNSSPGTEQDATQVGVELLRSFMKEHLPDYMVPSRFVRLEQLPYTTSGKLNRKLLPDPGDQRPEMEEEYVPPTTEIQKRIAGIWQEILDIKDIGIYDAFFDLGGNSLDLSRTLARVNQELGVNIPLRAVFEYPTVAQLAQQIEQASGQTGEVSKTLIPHLPDRPAWELSHRQMIYWYGAQTDAAAAEVGVEITRLVPILEGPLRVELLKKASHLVMKQYDIFHITYAERDFHPVQVINENTDIPLEVFDLSTVPPHQQEEQLAAYLLKELNRQFNLIEGPLGQLTLYKLDAGRHVLFFTGPHISFDGGSFFIIMKDLTNLYNALKSGEKEPSLPPAARYVEYAHWFNRRLKEGDLQDQADYWEKYIMEKIPVARLPYDYEDHASPKEPSKIYQLKLDAETAKKLDEVASSQDTTLFVTMLAILKTWIAILTNQSNITVGTVFSGRTHPELERIPGLMMNSLPIRVNLAGNPDCREIISRTKQGLLDVYSNQEYPLDLVAHKMRKVLDLNRDIYSIVFIGMEAPAGTGKFDGLHTRFRTLLDLTYGRNSKDNGFIQYNYHLENDLLIEMLREQGGIRLIVSYNHNKYRPGTIQLYFNRFHAVLNQFVTSLDLHMSQFPPLGMNELEEIF